MYILCLYVLCSLQFTCLQIYCVYYVYLICLHAYSTCWKHCGWQGMGKGVVLGSNVSCTECECDCVLCFLFLNRNWNWTCFNLKWLMASGTCYHELICCCIHTNFLSDIWYKQNLRPFFKRCLCFWLLPRFRNGYHEIICAFVFICVFLLTLATMIAWICLFLLPFIGEFNTVVKNVHWTYNWI